MTTATQFLSALGNKIGPHSLTDKDLAELGAGTLRVFRLMADLGWHSAEEIIRVSGQREGLRRMRELRQLGFEIDKQVMDGRSREFQYRLRIVPPTPPTQPTGLFDDQFTDGSSSYYQGGL